MSSLITADGGLTGAGYAVFIIAAAAVYLIASYIAGKFSKRGKFTARQLAFCGLSIALAYVCSLVKIFHLPFGGSVTLFSMLFIVLVGNWYGAGTGILVGLVYGILQFLQEPYFLSFIQVCCDYLFAFAALGLSGFFKDRKNGLTIGYIAGVIGRGVFASIAGYAFWMEYMPETFPASLSALYPIIYKNSRVPRP